MSRFVAYFVLILTVSLNLLLGTSQLYAGGGIAAAGVEVDAKGVLRKHVVDDPGGELYKHRIKEARATLPRDLAKGSKLRKISLNRLERALAARLAKGEFETNDMKYLAGLKRIKYVFFYPNSKDIVIAGPAEGYMLSVSDRAIGIETTHSIMELQDLIVALRAFPPSGHETSLIGVSIDPSKEGLNRMQQFLAGLRGIRPSDANRIAFGLRKSLGLQNVTIKGISPKSHFAQVLVEADYRMKLIGIGLESPPVSIKSYVARANPRDVARNAMQRWYFTPNYECVRVSSDHLAMELVGDGVKLIGEDERVTDDGGRVGAGRSNRASEAFVRDFTKKYAKLADEVPVYAQLRNLIDMVIAAAFIQEQDYYSQADWHLGTFDNEEQFPVHTYDEPTFVDSAVNVVWKGSTLMTPIGGGVNIQPLKALASENRLKDESGALPKLREQIKIEELAEDQWWWD